MRPGGGHWGQTRKIQNSSARPVRKFMSLVTRTNPLQPLSVLDVRLLELDAAFDQVRYGAIVESEPFSDGCERESAFPRREVAERFPRVTVRTLANGLG